MTRAGPLLWQTGAGWLVLGGGGHWDLGETGPVDAAALGWADSERPIAVLLSAAGTPTEGEDLLEYYADLGGAAGYVVPIESAADAHDPEYCRLLAQAGLVHLADVPDAVQLVRALWESPALEALLAAFDAGAAIVAQGGATMALGTWLATPEQPISGERGLAWVQAAILEPGFAGAASAARLRRMLAAHAGCLGIGIPSRSALALGPDGRVETIGDQQITVVVASPSASTWDDEEALSV